MPRLRYTNSSNSYSYSYSSQLGRGRRRVARFGRLLLLRADDTLLRANDDEPAVARPDLAVHDGPSVARADAAHLSVVRKKPNGERAKRTDVEEVPLGRLRTKVSGKLR